MGSNKRAVALAERKARQALRVEQRDRVAELRRFLVQEVWPSVPRRVLGRRMSRREREAILGYRGPFTGGSRREDRAGR